VGTKGLVEDAVEAISGDRDRMSDALEQPAIT
jgi:hypothetical protein